MAGGLKLFDYRMTEKEYILAETIIEMTDKSELFRAGLEHFDWSEIEVIPTGDRPHDFSYPDQAIYEWRNANPESFLEKMHDSEYIFFDSWSKRRNFRCSHALDTWNNRKYINTVIFG